MPKSLSCQQLSGGTSSQQDLIRVVCKDNHKKIDLDIAQHSWIFSLKENDNYYLQRLKIITVTHHNIERGNCTIRETVKTWKILKKEMPETHNICANKNPYYALTWHQGNKKAVENRNKMAKISIHLFWAIL